MDASFCVAKEAVSVLPNKRLQKLEDFGSHKLHCAFPPSLSDILEVMNHCNCYPEGPGSNIVDFTIILTLSGVGKVTVAVY